MTNLNLFRLLCFILSFSVSELKGKEDKSQWKKLIEDISVLQWVLSFLILGETCCTHTEREREKKFLVLNRNFHDASHCVFQ